MTRAVSDTLQRVQSAIDFVEAHLFEELPRLGVGRIEKRRPEQEERRLSVALRGPCQPAPGLLDPRPRLPFA